MKPLLREDPLQFYLIILEKLRYMNMFKGMVLKENHFISADGKNALLIGETPIKITDAMGAKDLIKYTRGVIDAHSAPGIAVSFLSGHSYTTANAETIKEDLYVILTCASFTILVLLFLFMQNWRAIFVFLVPTSVVCIATAGVLCMYHTISAVTIAFGSVLMGIADDYPIFTYFSLRGMGDYRGGSGCPHFTSRAVERRNYHGNLQRSFLFRPPRAASNCIFFHYRHHRIPRLFPCHFAPFHPGSAATKACSGHPCSHRGPLYRGIIIAGWLLLMALCLWQGSRLKFNGDMRAISMIPKAISEMEEQLKQTWGDFRGLAMVFAEGKDLESALRNNDQLFSYLKGKIPDDRIIESRSPPSLGGNCRRRTGGVGKRNGRKRTGIW